MRVARNECGGELTRHPANAPRNLTIGLEVLNIDIEALRAATPGCAEGRIHLMACGASLMPASVVDAVKAHLDLEARVGGYEAAESVASDIEAVYDSVARLVNCDRDEVALVENATRAWDMVFYAMDFEAGQRIVTGRNEYASNYIAFLHAAKRSGVEIEVIPDDEEGQLDVRALEAALARGGVALVAITHVPTHGGQVNPAAEIGQLCRRTGIPFLLDACQSAGQMPLDVEALGVDFLSATSRKFLRGPRGVGFLYVRRKWIERLEPPLLDLHAAEWTATGDYRIRKDARRFETWECNVAARLGFGVAVDLALSLGLEAIEARVNSLAERAREGLVDIPGLRLQDIGKERCGIVSWTMDGRSVHDVRSALARRGVVVGTSSILAARLEMEERGLEAVLRAGIHYYNTEDDIQSLIDALRGI